ncbi:hypothetical protein JCM10908_004406 [Rhodotorula pacifica]|uniref:uncharacterized protein n=1 Tax=Rhodotorula pacifica TaxID=1495444 RepID=UPI00317C1885
MLGRLAAGFTESEWKDREKILHTRRSGQAELWARQAAASIAALLPPAGSQAAFWVQLKADLYRWLLTKHDTLVYARDYLRVPAVDIANEICGIDIHSVLVYLSHQITVAASARTNQFIPVDRERDTYRDALRELWRERRSIIIGAYTSGMEEPPVPANQRDRRSEELRVYVEALLEHCRREISDPAQLDYTHHTMRLWVHSLWVLYNNLGLRNVLNEVEKSSLQAVLSHLKSSVQACMPGNWRQAYQLATNWTGIFVIDRFTGLFPVLSYAPLDPRYPSPSWLDPRHYRLLVLPLVIPAVSVRLQFLEPDELQPPAHGRHGYGGPHELARIGLRAQRRYRINSSGWKKRWQ